MKKFISLFSIFALMSISQVSLAQNKSAADTTIKEFAEVMPEFPGGQQAMMNFISENIKYPWKARMNEIQGRVMVQFVVDKTGAIRDVKVVNKVHPSLAKAAIKVVKKMPKWTPGSQDGKPVNVRFVMPITFKLE
ncbi:MAG TPA: energy transducer TonB [Bacteroidetes bacterium]|nr:energy transducer TonB [Bacteroidota bacterium]